MDTGDPAGNYTSIYLRYLRCPRLHTQIVCVDFDTKAALDTSPLWQLLQRKSCLTCETLHGFHCYVEMAGMPTIRTGYHALACGGSSTSSKSDDPTDAHHTVPGDLITGDHCNICAVPIRTDYVG
jgi:hypothetical protein